MKKALKVLVIFLSSIIALLVIAVVVINVFIDPNDFKPRIEKIVKEKTGRDVSFNGDIGLKVFPWLRLSMKDVALSNAAGFSPEQMLTFQEISVGVKILPLLRKNIEVSDVIIGSLTFNYAVNKSGVTNLDDILEKIAEGGDNKTAEKPSKEVKDEKVNEKKGSFDLNNINISKIAISDIVLNYSDARSGKKYNLGPLNLETGTINLKKPVEINVTGAVHGTKPKFDASFDIKTSMELGLAKNMVFESAKLGIKASLSFNLPDKNMKANMATSLNASFDNDTQKAVISNFNTDAAITGKSIPNGKQKIVLVMDDTLLDLKEQTFSFPKLGLDVANLHFIASASGTEIVDNPNVQIKAEIKEFSAKELMKNLGLDEISTSDPQALSKISMNFSAIYAEKILKPDLKLVLDNSIVTAKATANLSQKKPDIKADINISGLDADKYIPKTFEKIEANKDAVSAKKSDIKSNDDKANASAVKMDLTSLPNLNANITVGKVKVKNMQLDSIKASAILKDGVLNVKPFTIDLYGGRMSNGVKVIGTPKAFQAELSSELTPVNLKQILVAITGEPPQSSLPNKVSYSINAKFSDNLFNISKFNLNADELVADGTFSADLREKPYTNFKLAVNDVDLDKLLPANKSKSSEKDNKEVSKKVDTPDEPKKEFDLKDLPIDLDGELKVKSVKYEDITLRNIITKVSAKDGLLKLAPFSADTLGGSLKSIATLSGGSKSIKADFSLDVAGMRTEQIITTFLESKPFLSGNLDANLQLTSVGNDKESFFNNLNGNGKYKISNGVINGFAYDPKARLSNGKDLFGEGKKTTIADIKGNATIKNGMVTTEKATMTASNLKAEFVGGFYIKDFSLNYESNIIIDKVTIPMKITGSFKKPQFTIDDKKFVEMLIENEKKKLEEKAKKEIQKEIDKHLGEDGSKLIKGAEDALKNLFK